MSGYRIKQPSNPADYLETVVLYALLGLGCVWSGNVWAALPGGGWLLFVLWTWWQSWRTRVREIVFSPDDAVITCISRRGTEAIPFTQFLGVATASSTKRNAIGNHYFTALVPAKPYAEPLIVHQHIRLFARPAAPSQPAGEIRRQIADVTGLRDFGDAGTAAPAELYAKCVFLKNG